MYSEKANTKPSMITMTTSPKKTKSISRPEFEAQNLQQQLKLNDLRHKELMKENLLRKKRKEQQLAEEKRNKEKEQKMALEALKEERKEQYNRFLKQAVVRNKSANNSKLQSVLSPESKLVGYTNNQNKYLQNVRMNHNNSENSFEQAEKQIHVRMYQNRYENSGRRSNKSDISRDSVEKDLDEILERDLRAEKLRQEQEKENKRLSPIRDSNKVNYVLEKPKPSIENFLEEQEDYNDQKPIRECLTNQDLNPINLNTKTNSNPIIRENFKIRSRISGSTKLKSIENDYALQELRIKNSIQQISAQLPTNNRNNIHMKQETDILESISKLDQLLKTKQDKLQEIKKRPKSIISLPDQYNNSKMSFNTEQIKKSYAHHSDFKAKDILSNFQVSAKPQFPVNPYSQFNVPFNPVQAYPQFNFMPQNFHQLPVSAINPPVAQKTEDYVDFDIENKSNMNTKPFAQEKRIRDVEEIGNIDKENQNSTNLKKLRPISLINETNSYSVLTDMIPARTDLNGIYADKSYFQRRNMQKNMVNKDKPKTDVYKDEYELKDEGDGKIQYHPQKLRELFDE